GSNQTDGLAEISANVITNILQTNISSGATFRNSLNINNSGMGAGPVSIASGGVFELTRNGLNGTATATAATTLTNVFSGAGDIKLNGVATTQSNAINSAGAYTINADNSAFSGRWVLNNARINVDNGNGLDELGSARVVIPSGSAALVAGTVPHEGNIFEIAGNGWVFEPTANFGPLGALRLNATGATIGATSQVQLTADARIAGQNVLGNIVAPISGGFNVQFGTPEPLLTQNGTLILTGTNTYTGNTSISNHTIGASNNAAFGTGTVTLNGVSTARVTQLNVGNGVTISNPIVMNDLAGQGGRGAIEGAGVQQVTNTGAGVGTVSGPITLATLLADRGHFGSGAGLGSVLRVTSQVTLPTGDTIIQRSSTANGYTEFTGNNFISPNYTKFDLSGGTVRLGSTNALNSGVDLITRNVAATGNLDMRDFDHTFNSVIRGSTVTGSNFNLVNTGTGTSTLTITSATASSEIQNIPLNASGGIVNIVKNGTGALALTGTTANLGNTGIYTINGGNFSVAAGQTAAGTLIANARDGRTTIIGSGTISGSVTVTGSVLFSGGFSPGVPNPPAPAAPSMASSAPSSGDLTVNGIGIIDWELIDAGIAQGSGELAIGSMAEPIQISGTLNLSGASEVLVNIKSLSALATPGNALNFDPNLQYSWMLLNTADLVGFDASKFVINASEFTNLPVNSAFRVSQSGSGVVLQYGLVGVPEPSSISLLVASIGTFVMRHRRRLKGKTRG
ncbi:MAG: PEP-CTERM sorting domain-containing protein, partial [Pirellulaceae bacterium]|nr:PEP-CTERM sorting domain-containing protein [Pirellulaceae bacterium]